MRRNDSSRFVRRQRGPNIFHRLISAGRPSQRSLFTPGVNFEMARKSQSFDTFLASLRVLRMAGWWQRWADSAKKETRTSIRFRKRPRRTAEGGKMAIRNFIPIHRLRDVPLVGRRLHPKVKSNLRWKACALESPLGSDESAQTGLSDAREVFPIGTEPLDRARARGLAGGAQKTPLAPNVPPMRWRNSSCQSKNDIHVLVRSQWCFPRMKHWSQC